MVAAVENHQMDSNIITIDCRRLFSMAQEQEQFNAFNDTHVFACACASMRMLILYV